MDKKQTVAIIGATGITGKALAYGLANEDGLLLLFDHDKNAADELVASVLAAYPKAKVEAMGCAVDACWEADVIFVAGMDEEGIAAKISKVANLKMVIRMIGIDQVAGILPIHIEATEMAARQLSNSRLVTVYHTVCPISNEDAELKMVTTDDVAARKGLQLIRRARIGQRRFSPIGAATS